MIVDASALLAIVFQEEGAVAYMRKLADSPDENLISPINFVEAAIRIDKIGDEAPKLFAELVRIGNVKLAEVSEAQTQLAREAYQNLAKATTQPN
jgi:ribonuclease VapC